MATEAPDPFNESSQWVGISTSLLDIANPNIRPIIQTRQRGYLLLSPHRHQYHIARRYAEVTGLQPIRQETEEANERRH